MQKKFKVLLSTVLSTSLVVGGVVGVLLNNNNNNVIEEVEDNGGIKVDNIMCRGVSVKKLSTSTNSQGQAVQTFNYSVTPANASNQAVTATVKYKDGTDCSAVMAVTTDTATKTISLTCKGEFAKQITLTVTSAANASAKATATIDYEKKIKSVTSSVESITIDANSTATNDSNFYTVNYSQFSKDKTYNFEKTLNVYDVDEDLDSFSAYSGVKAGLLALANKAFNQGYVVTANDIWNLSSSNEFHSKLVANSWGEGELALRMQLDVKCTTTNHEYIKTKEIAVYFNYSSFTYTGKTVGVDSIALDQSGFVF